MSCRAPGTPGTTGARTPLALLGSIVGGCLLGAVGAIVGLAVGLAVYPPTAWAAMVELGAPAALLGAVAGALVGAGLDAGRRRRTRRL